MIAGRAAPVGAGLLLCAAVGLVAASPIGPASVAALVGLIAAIAVWRYARAPIAAVATLGVWGGYILFSRDFASLGVSAGGLPLYIGELLLLVAVPWAITRPELRGVLKHPFFLALSAWMVFCAVRLLAGGLEYGIDALRDSAIWYYGAFAFIGYVLWRAFPSATWTRFFS